MVPALSLADNVEQLSPIVSQDRKLASPAEIRWFYTLLIISVAVFN